jgi:hypothetical protein
MTPLSEQLDSGASNGPSMRARAKALTLALELELEVELANVGRNVGFCGPEFIAKSGA